LRFSALFAVNPLNFDYASYSEFISTDMYSYLKALHIIFIVTWFAGMFYIVRLFIYNVEASGKPEPEKGILQKQFGIMIRRLWLGITWPSAILTLILGPWVMFSGSWDRTLASEGGRWLLIKLVFVLLLYNFSLHSLYKQQSAGIYKYSSQQLRVWNEVATVFLVAIVILATTKATLSWAWGIGGLLVFVLVLMISIKTYKHIRSRKP
jgi:protoporphyrinogen IX oxidase